MNLGQKIEQLLKTTAMTKVELAKKLGLKDSSVISHWVKNRFKPDRANITKLAGVFKKPVSYFEDDDLYCAEDSSYKLTEKKVYELLSSLPAAKRIGVQSEVKTEFFDFPLYFHAEEFLPILLESANREPFAIKILTTEACPWAVKEEYALCVPVQDIKNGKLYLVKTPKGYTIKKVYVKSETTNLKDFYGKTETFKNKEITIFAHILAFYRKP